MVSDSEKPPSNERPARPRRRRGQWSVRLTPVGVLVLFACNLVLLGGLAWPILQTRLGLPTSIPQVLVRNSPTPSGTVTPTLTSTQTDTPPPTKTQTPNPTIIASLYQGVIVLSMNELGRHHLFAYQPLQDVEWTALALTRLTNGEWDDLSPAVSPDGSQVAFTSNRNGYWDIYLLDLSSGSVDRVTDSLEYDGSPGWSPDGLWLVYESYIDESLEIFIRSVVDRQQPPIRLTASSSADHSPAWSPLGRQIAFVSDRSGESEIWLAELDQADESLFINISQSPGSLERYPAWSPDGSLLAWSTIKEGIHNLVAWDSSQPDEPVRILGGGDLPAWSPDGQYLLATLFTPHDQYLTAYPAASPGLVVPPVALSGPVNGIDWADATFTLPWAASLQLAAELTPTSLWLPVLTPGEGMPGGRRRLVEQNDLQAPFPFFQDMVDESFLAMRQRLSNDIGWDFLSSLENAYVPLAAPLDPGMGDSWLYTGRSFTLNPGPLNAGWMVVVREEFGTQTFWRVYLRTRYQDGSAGLPLKDLPWDLNARYQGDPQAYEQGGALYETIPPGYWYDFTQLANSYGWERLSALISWRAAFSASRFNEFAFTDGLDWSQAMLEIYPPEVLLTPTIVVPATRTPTITPRWYQSPTPTVTVTPRPTLTPVPPSDTPGLPTPTATRTPQPSRTPTRNLTPTP